MTRLRKSAGNGFPQPFAKPCWVSHISTQARRRRSLTTEHFSAAAIHLRKPDFLSEGWGVPHQTGSEHVTGLGPKGDREDKSRFITVWKKVNGEWKVAYDVDWSTMPEPPTPPK
jgi:hypothetical protein